MLETWKEIEGFSNYYVSNHGRIKNTFKIMKQKVSKTGYSYAMLYKNKSRIDKPVHRLVANAFLDNAENKPTVNHIDGNKLNNNISNLEWATYSENNKHAYDIGIKRRLFGEDNFHSKKVIQLSLNGDVINEFISYVEANKIVGTNRGHISSCCNGKRKTAGGYKWKLKEFA